MVAAVGRRGKIRSKNDPTFQATSAYGAFRPSRVHAGEGLLANMPVKVFLQT
jgi:hypothetical protein